MIHRLAVACFTLVGVASPAFGLDIPSGAYTLDKGHAYITFSYSHLGFSTPHVGFNDFDVAVQLDAANLEKSTLSVTIDPASIDSRVAEFDKHLVGENFFNVAEHPTITFNTTAIKMTGETTADITGDLTIKGITKPVTLVATINKAANHPMLKKPVLGVSATGKLNRTEWDLGQYAPAVGDEVDLFLTVELPKAD